MHTDPWDSKADFFIKPFLGLGGRRYIVSLAISFIIFGLKKNQDINYLNFYTSGKILQFGERRGGLFITFAFSKWRYRRISEAQACSEFRKDTRCQ